MSELSTDPNLGTDSETLSEYIALREGCGRLLMPNLRCIRLIGEDRIDWLQGQVTNDVSLLRDGGKVSFCVCSSTGQIQAIVDAWPVGEEVWLVCSEECAGTLIDRIQKMVVMEDVSINDSDEELELISVLGPEASERVSQVFDSKSGKHQLGHSHIYLLQADRIGGLGIDIWVPRNGVRLICDQLQDIPEVGHLAYNVARLEAGIPLFGADTTERTLPPELGSYFEASHVSFRKGCYVGQEVLMRIHSRGHANRKWVALKGDQPFTVGAVISHPDRSDAGNVTSAVYSPQFGYIAGAMLRNEFAVAGNRIRVESQIDDIDAEVIEFPLLALR